MKYLIKVIFISLIFIICQSNQQLTEYKIDINASNTGGGKIKISISTNFPDGTNLNLNVGREYYVKGDKEIYSGGLFDKVFTVINGKFEITAIINDKEWYNEHQRLVRALPDDVQPITKISDNITIDVLYTAAATQPSNVLKILGTRGEYVTGKGSEHFGTGTAGRITTLRISKALYFPMEGRSEKSSEYASYKSLKVNGTYAISKETPLTPGIHPGDPLEAIKDIKYLPSGCRIRILTIQDDNDVRWYEVQAISQSGKQIGKGWINSIALIGQELLVIK